MTRKFLIAFGLFALLPALVLATGSAFAGTVRIVVPAHDIARGDTISDGDLTYTTVDGAVHRSRRRTYRHGPRHERRRYR